MCEQNTCNKQRITKQSLIKANQNGFGNEVGSITNRCTAMFDILAKFPKNSSEYKDMLYRITCMQGYQQEIIDSCKGIMPKRVPKEWYSYKKVKIKDEDTYEEREKKMYNKQLLANKKPYFFIYNYKYLKNEYNNYIKNSNTNCIIKFGISLEELKNKQDRNEDEELFIQLFYNLCPVSDNNSVVNRIAHKLEEKFDKLSIKINKSEFDKFILITKKRVKNDIIKELNNLYSKYKKDIQDIMKSNNNNENIEENKIQRKLYMQEFKENALKCCNDNEEILCNGLIQILYNNNNSKQFVWDICGDYIVNKLLKDNNNIINIPIKSKDGQTVWNGENYKLIQVKLNKEENK